MSSDSETLSHDVIERSRKNEQVILQGLASVGQKSIADGLSVDESTVSRMKNGELRRLATLLALCGFKVVPSHHKCGDPDMIEAYGKLLKKAMEHDGGISLIWD